MSLELQKTVSGYESYINNRGIDLECVWAYHNAVFFAEEKDNDLQEALKIAVRAKEVLNQFCIKQYGGDIWELEKFCFANKTGHEMVDKWYEILKLEAQNKVLDSYLLFLEKNRVPRERFYAPKRKQFAKFGLIDAYQGAIDDKYDIVCVSLVPGSGKTTLLKFFNSAVIGWFPKDYNLFYSHSGDITRMYYDGVMQMVTDSQEYTWHEIFPDLQVTSTNAKMQQFNVGPYKAFQSLQTTSVGAESAGKVRASKFLFVDDMIGKQEEGKPCKEIINATRWSTVDVIGRVIQIYYGNPRVKVISMPDIDPQTGESNFNYEFGGLTVEFFKDQALTMDDISYRCLFKQEPIEREGLLYHEDEIRRYSSLPDREPDAIIGVCDTKSKGIDYMVLPCVYQYGDDYYMVDCVCDNGSDFGLQKEKLSNMIVDNNMQQCEFESNAGGDRLAHEVNEMVESKGGRCNITTKATETNKETRIIVNSDWVKKHCLFRDKDDYTQKSDYGVFMSFLLSYSVAGKNKFDDVPDCMANFALYVSRGKRVATVEAVQNPFRTGGYGYGF